MVRKSLSEYPELQGVIGKYFALAQGFEEDVANAISDHYLPVGINSPVPKKPISYSISIVDKLDSLVGFFLINEKPTSLYSINMYGIDKNRDTLTEDLVDMLRSSNHTFLEMRFH